MNIITNNKAIAVAVAVAVKKARYPWNNGEDKELFQALYSIHGHPDNWHGSSYIATLRHLAVHKYGNTADDIGGLKMRVDYLRSNQKASYFRSKGRIGVFLQVTAGAIAAGVCTYKELAPRIQG